MSKSSLFAAAMLFMVLPAQAQSAAVTHERTMELVRSCRYFVRENVPDGAEFPNPYDELPTIKAIAKGKGLAWEDRVKIRTPLYVQTKKFVCIYNPATDKINISWKG